jgi:hypothetical protein
VKEVLGKDFVITTGNESFAEVVVAELERKTQQLHCEEVGTGGLLMSELFESLQEPGRSFKVTGTLSEASRCSSELAPDTLHIELKRGGTNEVEPTFEIFCRNSWLPKGTFWRTSFKGLPELAAKMAVFRGLDLLRRAALGLPLPKSLQHT